MFTNLLLGLLNLLLWPFRAFTSRRRPTGSAEPPFTEDKKRIIKAVLSVLESGTLAADFGEITIVGDMHGITYGAYRTTDGGDSSLDKVVKRYVELGGLYAPHLKGFLNKLQTDATVMARPPGRLDRLRDIAGRLEHAGVPLGMFRSKTTREVEEIPDWVRNLMHILELAGDRDPLMAQAQSEIFEESYWGPASHQAAALGLKTPLGWLICCDSVAQSGQRGAQLIDRFFWEKPPGRGGDERQWALAYLKARRLWLEKVPRSTTTVYRIKSLLALAEADNWNLETPVHIAEPEAIVH